MAIRALYDVPAPAKLNLFLHLRGRRDDGYHLLDSLMVPIDWCDTMHFERRDDGALTRRDLSAALPADDLALRAARALQNASGTPLGADISIDKQVPWSAGLGGGSSDAASTLLALNRLWQLDWPLARLLPIGLALGADVPFFLGGSPARVAGIGELLTPVALAPAWFAVVKPVAGLDTGRIFASRQVASAIEAARIAGFSDETSGSVGGYVRGYVEGNVRGSGQGGEQDVGSLVEGFGRNDLEAAAIDLCPDVAPAMAELLARFGNSRMTGSGSAVFARAGHGTEPSATMPSHWPRGWSSRMCRSLERHPLADWARREEA